MDSERKDLSVLRNFVSGLSQSPGFGGLGVQDGVGVVQVQEVNSRSVFARKRIKFCHGLTQSGVWYLGDRATGKFIPVEERAVEVSPVHGCDVIFYRWI